MPIFVVLDPVVPAERQTSGFLFKQVGSAAAVEKSDRAGQSGVVRADRVVRSG